MKKVKRITHNVLDFGAAPTRRADEGDDDTPAKHEEEEDR
jgi:hypothetical protein